LNRLRDQKPIGRDLATVAHPDALITSKNNSKRQNRIRIETENQSLFDSYN